MPSPSQTSIVNNALTRLGSRTFINSVDDSTTVGRHCLAAWYPAVELVLASHNWNFAIRRAVLSESCDPAFGFTHAYTLPADCVRWLPPSREDDGAYFEGVQEGSVLLTNAEPPLPVRYISRTLADDLSRWPGTFVEAVTTELMRRLAETITQSETIKSDATDEAKAARREAKRVDGLSSGNRSRVQVTRGSDWLSARNRPYSGYER